MLKKVLNSNEVKESVIGFLNFFLKADRKESEEIFVMVQNEENKNSLHTEISNKGNLDAGQYPIQYENTLNYSKEKDMFLLESRLFDSNDAMIDSHLLLINAKDLTLKNGYVDDVWTYANDWQLTN